MVIFFLLLIFFIMIITFLIVFNCLLYNYYVDQTESYNLAKFTFVVTMCIGLFCLMLIPIDVYIVSDIQELQIEEAEYIYSLQKVYLVLYLMLLFMAFFLIPFTYFYGNDDNERFSQSQHYLYNIPTTQERIAKAFKRTSVYLIICFVLLVCGIYFTNMNKNKATEYKWEANLFQSNHIVEQVTSFVTNMLINFGILLLLIYTGYGLGALPFFLIKGKEALTTKSQEIEDYSGELNESIVVLERKLVEHGHLSTREHRELLQLREEKSLLERKLSRIKDKIESEDFVNRIILALNPYRSILGISFLITSLLIFISIIITSIDKFLNSKCGVDCGFVLDDKKYLNYIDSLLLFLAKYYHLDYIFFFSINFYVFLCTIFGFIKLGVGCLCFAWFEFKKRDSNPQGLLIMSIMVLVITLAFSMEIQQTLAPQYSTFGVQTFLDDSPQKGAACTLSMITNAQKRVCIMSNLSKFYDRISVTLPLFSIFIYVFNWIFIVTIFFSILYSASKGDYERDSVVRNFDDEELDGFVNRVN